MQTKKGQTGLQADNLSQKFTEWLIEIRDDGLATDEEVHEAAPKGKL